MLPREFLVENETAEVDALEQVWSASAPSPDPAPGG
jgi:hypothetical protein